MPRTFLGNSPFGGLLLRPFPLSNVEFVFASMRPERTDSKASTPSYALFGMKVSLLERARGPLCLGALVVGARVWGSSRRRQARPTLQEQRLPPTH
jgi:hypothetical protein